MKRRDFLVSVAMFATATEHASAQQTGAKMKRVAMFHPAMKPADMRIGGDPTYAIIFEEMERLGYVEGTNLVVDRYSAEGRYERFAELARAIVATRPNVICAMSNPPVFALQSETRTIPIVAWTGDPVAAGIISSLARPGGNVTGVSIDAGPELGGKRVQFLAEAVGNLSNLRLLAPPISWQSPMAKAAQETADKMNIPFRYEALQSPINESEYRRAFHAMRQDHVDGVLISADSDNYTNRLLLGGLTLEYRLPAVCSYSDSVRAGALMSYAYDLKGGARRLAAQIVEILSGGNPADMPFFQETHFELVINLKAAKELGLEIPAGLVARADEVIE
jgi:putative tryptophan/tyrosine transport system substrate-binding protein